MSVVTSFVHSWATAERKCFEYLQSALGTIEGAQGFTPETIPPAMTGTEPDFYIWFFKISGGTGSPLNRNTRSEAIAGGWMMDAEFKAWCVTDAIAKQVGGTVIGALPALASDIPSVGKLYATSYPMIDRTTKSIVNGDNAGQERVFFELTIPMRAVFDNMERVI